MQSFILKSNDLVSHLEKIIDLSRVNISIDKFLNHPDVHLIQETKTKVGIDRIRQMIIQSSLKPYSLTGKVFILNHAHNLTLESQNALLKTLEEPPLDCTIFLITPTPEKLLPTVLSRCQLLNLQSSNLSESSLELDIEHLCVSPSNFLYKWEKKLTSNESAVDFYAQLIHSLRRMMLNSKQGQSQWTYATFIREVGQALKFARANVNLKLVLVNLSLKLSNVTNPSIES